MKTVQLYNIHLIGGEVIQAAEAFELQGKKTLTSIYQNADDDDIFCILDFVWGSCYFQKKNIVYIATAGVRENAERDSFETNIFVMGRAKKSGSKD